MTCDPVAGAVNYHISSRQLTGTSLQIGRVRNRFSSNINDLTNGGLDAPGANKFEVTITPTSVRDNLSGAGLNTKFYGYTDVHIDITHSETGGGRNLNTFKHQIKYYDNRVQIDIQRDHQGRRVDVDTVILAEGRLPPADIGTYEDPGGQFSWVITSTLLDRENTHLDRVPVPADVRLVAPVRS